MKLETILCDYYRLEQFAGLDINDFNISSPNKYDFAPLTS